jgi:uncharacterized protein (TIGR03437 family)
MIKIFLLAVLTVSPALAQGVITTVAGNDAIFQDDGKPALSAALAGPNGLAVDQNSNLYIASPVQNMVFKVDTKGTITIVAGNGLKRYAGDGGPARAASLAAPSAVALDHSGNLYIADSENCAIRRVAADGTITTVAGSGPYGYSGDGGAATQAKLSFVYGVGLDSAGNLYISDNQNSRVRKVNSAGVISTIAGNGTAGNSGDGGPSVNALLSFPGGLAVDANGSVYVETAGVVRKINTAGVISTVAGGGGGPLVDGGLATDGGLNRPFAVAVDSAGYLYVTEQTGERVRRVSPSGIITTVAGNGKAAFAGDGSAAISASLSAPSGVAADSSGNIYIGDSENDRVRRVDASGVISTIAGQGASIGDSGPAPAARLDKPWGIATDSAGNLFIADQTNHRVRMVTPAGLISTVAGNGRQGYSGDGGPATAASLNSPWDVKLDAANNMYIADAGNSVIRKVSPSGTITTFAGGGPCCAANDGGPATSVFLGFPDALAVDNTGNVYTTDLTQVSIRKITPRGTISTIAGGGGRHGYGGDGGPATSATFNGQFGALLADPAGNVYVCDQLNNRVRKIDTQGIITTFAGNGNSGRTGDGGPANVATAGNPVGLAQDQTGRIYIVDGGSVRVVNPDGTIHAYAGGGQSGFSGDGGPAANASFNNLEHAALDPAGNLFVSDTYNRRIRLIQAGPSPAIVASEKGLTFIASTGGGTPASQTFTIVNAGQGTLNWGVTASTTSGGNWLTVTPPTGSSAAGLAGPPVQVSVNPSGLPAGDYYGQIVIQAPGAPNSPQSVTVVLTVRSPGSGTGSIVQPSGLLFTSATPQSLTLTTLSTSPVTYAGTASFGGKQWFTLPAPSGTTVSGKPASVQIVPNLSGLASGVYNGNITFAFGDNSLQNVQLLLVISSGPTAQRGGQATSKAACIPTTLLPLFTSLGSGFTLTTGWPSPVELTVVDDCGQPLTRGTVTASFSNSDPSLNLNPLGDGRWTGTWSAQNAAPSVTVSASAQTADKSISGSAQVAGGLTQNANPPPVVAAGGVLNAASYQLQGPLAPGSLISIFGSLLSQGAVSAPALPLTNTLGNTTVTVAGRTLPLLYAGSTQVNAMIPFDLPINATHQLVVQRGTAISVPQPVSVLSSESGVFTSNLTGTGAGIVVRVTPDGSQSVVSTDNPAQAGDGLVIYCAGLGDVSPRQLAGHAVPFTPLSTTLDSVQVTIGGVQVPPFFAGLTPGFTGLYQVNVIVPAGLTPGDNVPLVISQAGRSSPPVSLSVR